MLRRLRQHHEGILSFGELVEPVRFVLDPASGQPVLPVPYSALGYDSVVLFAPDDGLDNPECLQVTAAPQEIDPNREEACDRHGAYFGKPAHVRWARLLVESVKRLDEVVDGDLIRLANPLRSAESELCRAANADPAKLAAACERMLGVKPAEPKAVGVDPWGIDVRARFGVARLEFPEPVGTKEEAVAMIEKTVRGA
ncbi:MAG TPA: hypothetical protein VD971_10780 [Phycisphaerales bacterium]|nr:hypothetical protein [Phycisphaerales bacterium]